MKTQETKRKAKTFESDFVDNIFHIQNNYLKQITYLSKFKNFNIMIHKISDLK